MRTLFEWAMTAAAVVWLGWLVGAAFVVIWAGVARCPHCGGWHANKEEELRCKERREP